MVAKITNAEKTTELEYHKLGFYDAIFCNFMSNKELKIKTAGLQKIHINKCKYTFQV